MGDLKKHEAKRILGDLNQYIGKKVELPRIIATITGVDMDPWGDEYMLATNNGSEIHVYPWESFKLIDDKKPEPTNPDEIFLHNGLDNPCRFCKRKEYLEGVCNHICNYGRLLKNEITFQVDKCDFVIPGMHIIVNIDWCLDDDDQESPPSYIIPTEKIPVDEVADWLSDHWGFLVNSYSIANVQTERITWIPVSVAMPDMETGADLLVSLESGRISVANYYKSENDEYFRCFDMYEPDAFFALDKVIAWAYYPNCAKTE